MKISKALSFPGDPQTVFEMLCDPAFQAAKCVAAHADEHEESVVQQGPNTKVVVSRSMKTDKMPGLVKSMLGPMLTVNETYVWHPLGSDGSRRGTLLVTVSGAPVGMTADIALKANGASRSVMTIIGEMRAKMFMGSQVEKLAEPWIVKGLDKEEETGAVWLGQG